MNGMSTFLSIPRLSKTRKRFALGYLLFILLLITPIYIPWSKLPETATGAFILFFFITPLMLLGARSLLPLALRFIHAAQKSD